MSKPIFDVADLPKPLQTGVATAMQKGSPGEVLDQLEDYLFSGGERTMPVLLAQAYCEVEFACTVMVDEVLERTTKALTLLDEAIALGSDKKALKTFRSRCQSLNQKAKRLEDETGKLEAVDSADLSDHQLTELAYQLDEKGGVENNARAAELWRLAYQRGTEDWDRHDRYVRIGLCLAEAKKWDEALPILETIVHTQPSHPGHERWMTEFAYGHLLDHAVETEDQNRYLDVWHRAVSWAKQEDDGYFPVPRPRQDKALEICVKWKLREQCESLLAIIEQHRPPRTISAAVRKLMKEAQRLVGG